MKKISSIVLGLSLVTTLSAQVGINTNTPQGVFHVDAQGDNSATPTEAETKDDFVVLADGRIGIGTSTPDGSAAIDISSADKGVLFPRINLLTEVMQLGNNPNATGLVIVNTGNVFPKGVYYWDGITWINLYGQRAVSSPSIDGLVNCNGATMTPTEFTKDVPFSGILSVPYSGGNGGSYDIITQISSTGAVYGLTATLRPGKLATGSGDLIFDVTGTPSASSPEVVSFLMPSLFNATACEINIGTKDFAINEIKSTSFSVSMDIFNNASASKQYMHGRNIGDVSSTTNQYLSEAAGLANNSSDVLIINGMRLDFLYVNNGYIRPIFVNTTSNNIRYHVSSLSTHNAFTNGTSLVIAPNTGSFGPDGDSTFWLGDNSSAEFIRSQLTFDDGSWYEVSFYANQVDGTVSGYFTVQRLK